MLKLRVIHNVVFLTVFKLKVKLSFVPFWPYLLFSGSSSLYLIHPSTRPLAQPAAPESQHSLRHEAHGLADAQIGEDFLGAAQDGVELVGAVELLDHAAHARLGDAAAAKDVDGVVGHVVCAARRVRLQQPDRPAQQLVLLCVRHVGHLEGDGLEPRLARFAQGDHFGEFLCTSSQGRQVGSRSVSHC